MIQIPVLSCGEGPLPFTCQSLHRQQMAEAHLYNVPLKGDVVAGQDARLVVGDRPEDGPRVVAGAVDVLFLDGGQRAAGERVGGPAGAPGHEHSRQQHVGRGGGVHQLQATLRHVQLRGKTGQASRSCTPLPKILNHTSFSGF